MADLGGVEDRNSSALITCMNALPHNGSFGTLMYACMCKLYKIHWACLAAGSALNISATEEGHEGRVGLQQEVLQLEGRNSVLTASTIDHASYHVYPDFHKSYVVTAVMASFFIAACLMVVVLRIIRGVTHHLRETDSSPGMSPRASVQIACADPPPYEVVADQPPPYWSIQSPPPYTDHAAAAKTPDDDVVT